MSRWAGVDVGGEWQTWGNAEAGNYRMNFTLINVGDADSRAFYLMASASGATLDSE